MIQKKSFTDEIEFDQIFNTLWRGKKKIIIIIIISILIAVGVNINRPEPSVTSITEIKPLSEDHLNNFEVFNSLKIYNIDNAKLYNIFLENLKKRTALKTAIKELEIISRENYKNNEEYEEAVSIESYRIKINSLLDQINGKVSFNIILQNTDNRKLFQLIKYIREENNKLSIKNLETEFNNKILTLRQLDELKKKDIQIKIQDSKDDYDQEIKILAQRLKFEIEDINVKIENAIADNKLKDERRIEYLKEQASIARKLQLPKISTVNILGNISEKTLYLMGYIAIEKKIEIIKNRKKIKLLVNAEGASFDNKYATLLKKKRALNQNKNVERKELNKLYLDEILKSKKSLRDIEKNEILFLRAERLFEENILKFSDSFETVIFDPYSTIFESKQKSNYPAFPRILFIAIFLGIITSVLYVILEEKIKNIITKTA